MLKEDFGGECVGQRRSGMCSVLSESLLARVFYDLLARVFYDLLARAFYDLNLCYGVHLHA
jgi:hypothetical protein